MACLQGSSRCPVAGCPVKIRTSRDVKREDALCAALAKLPATAESCLLRGQSEVRIEDSGAPEGARGKRRLPSTNGPPSKGCKLDDSGERHVRGAESSSAHEPVKLKLLLRRRGGGSTPYLYVALNSRSLSKPYTARIGSARFLGYFVTAREAAGLPDSKVPVALPNAAPPCMARAC